MEQTIWGAIHVVAERRSSDQTPVAPVAELVDATDSKSVSFTGVPVRVWPGAPPLRFKSVKLSDLKIGAVTWLVVHDKISCDECLAGRSDKPGRQHMSANSISGISGLFRSTARSPQPPKLRRKTLISGDISPYRIAVVREFVLSATMLNFIRSFIFILLPALAAGALVATAPPAIAGPALLFEAATGKVLYAENPDHQWHPASLTKIMTAYIAFEEMKAGRLTADSKLVTTEEAFKMEPSKIGLPIGAKMSLDLALKSLIIKSANDVSVMFAQKISGSVAAFSDRMNATAKRLGMTRTNFANPNGLPNPAQITTARDLAKLSRALVKDFPEHAHFWSMPRFKIGKRSLASHNSLLRTFAGADGLKTGFICDSGYNVVASATRDGRKLMAVVLGEPSGRERGLRAASLLEHGFQQFGWKTLFNTTNIDNLPIQPDAARVRSVRNTVKSWACKTPAQRRAISAQVRRERKLRKLRRKQVRQARTAAKRRGKTSRARKKKK